MNQDTLDKINEIVNFQVYYEGNENYAEFFEYWQGVIALTLSVYVDWCVPTDKGIEKIEELFTAYKELEF
jgi:hypothetical protein